MNLGKTLFAQLMDFLPWKTFHRIVDRHHGDRYVKSMTCAEQFRVMAFAQLTYRESLRDIEVCLSAQSAKLYHMGFRQEIKRSTLADANEARDWRIHAAFAEHLIAQARKLYVGDSLGFELESTAYAPDSTTIDLCLSVFPWAPFRTTKAAVKMRIRAGALRRPRMTRSPSATSPLTSNPIMIRCARSPRSLYPVLRTNALPVLGIPTSCGRIQYSEKVEFGKLWSAIRTRYTNCHDIAALRSD